jgi:hypothetical protein
MVRKLTIIGLFVILFLSKSNSIFAQTPTPTIQPGFARPNTDMYHHHIHSFSVNYTMLSKPDTYAYEHRHANELGYSMISFGKPTEAKYGQQSVLRDHNAMIFPLDLIDLNQETKKFSFRSSVHGMFNTAENKYRSAFDTSKYVDTPYAVTEEIITLIKNNACARPNADLSRLTLQTYNAQLITELFFTNWVVRDANNVVSSMTLLANWQNRSVVQSLIQKTVDTLNYENANGIFFDQISGWPSSDSCGNAGSAKYGSWREGQKALLTDVIGQLRNKVSSSGRPYFISGNFGNPKLEVNEQYAQWYKDGSLRFDHYYSEWGIWKDPQTGKVYSLKADGVDPETGKPAYINGSGYFPADRVAVDTEYGWYGMMGVDDYGQMGFGYREDDYWDASTCELPAGQDDYFTQHLRAGGIAGVQGSWFGYYGEDVLHDKDEWICESGIPRRKTDWEKQLIYTNAMQLVRAIPNWDNLVGIPIRVSGSKLPSDPRYFDETNMIYKSTNSYASRDVVYARHFQTGELFIVFRSLNGEVVLKTNESVKSAYFVNKYFEKTIEDARSCLLIQQNTVKLHPSCSNKLEVGIRISSNNLPYGGGLVSYWNFNEGSGTVLYDSASGINGTIQGAVWGTGKTGMALTFDGTNDLVRFGDVLNMETSDMSVSLYVKTATTNPKSVLVSKAYEIPYYYLYLTNGKVVMALHNGREIKTVSSTSSVNNNAWHSIVAIWKRAGNMTLVIDGKKEAELDISVDKEIVISNNNLFTLGANCYYEDQCGNYFNGMLDEVKIYNMAISCGMSGDVDCNGIVNLIDLSRLLSKFGQSGTVPEDVDNNGVVNLVDLSILLSNFGENG